MRKAFLYLLFVQLLDYLTTAYLIAKAGYEVEANPFLFHLMRVANTPYAILYYKMFGMLVYAGSMFWLYKRHPERFAHPIWKSVVLFFNIAYTIVVIRSLYAIYTII